MRTLAGMSEEPLWVECVCGERTYGDKRWEEMWGHIDTSYKQGDPVHYAKGEGAVTRPPEKK